MKKLVLLGFLVSAGLSSAQTALKINGHDVSLAHLQLVKQSLLARMGLQPGMVDDAAVTKSAVDQLVAFELLAQAAGEAKITVDSAEVTAAIAKEKQQIGGEEGFAEALKRAGITKEELEKIEGQTLLVRKFIEKEIAPKANVSPADVEAYYKAHPEEFRHEEQIKLQMILTRPGSNDEKGLAEAKARADAAAKRVAGGEDFAKVASEVSEDRSRANGGEIGWVRKGMLLKELEEPVFALQPGELSQVLKSQFGYHVFRVAERRPAGQYPFEEVKDNLSQMLQQKKSTELLQKIIEERKAKVAIEGVDPQVKAALTGAGPSPSKDGKQ